MSMQDDGHSGEIGTGALLERLARHPERALIFSYEGRDVLPGYHVTEVKSAAVRSLDCGANAEAWSETFVQLWDVPEPDRTWMPCGKFLAIMGKVAGSVALGDKLTFEVSDGVAAMRLYRAGAIEEHGEAVRVALSRRPAGCKPRDRWLEQQPAPADACCGPASSSPSCCGVTG